MIVGEELHYAGVPPAGLIASLFTAASPCPHDRAAGDADQIEHLGPSDARRRDDRFARHHRARRRLRRRRHPHHGAVRDGDDYIVNGAKTFITSGVRADFVVTAVRTGGTGAHGLSLLVVDSDTPGFEVTRKLDKMGWRCSDTAELSYVDVPCAGRRTWSGPRTRGSRRSPQNFVTERISLAVQAYASAQRCLDLTVEWCRARDTFGRPLISRQTVQHTLAEMARRIDVARVYTRANVALRRSRPARPI